jgi:hypothetical protein
MESLDSDQFVQLFAEDAVTGERVPWSTAARLVHDGEVSATRYRPVLTAAGGGSRHSSKPSSGSATPKSNAMTNLNLTADERVAR